MRTNVTGFYKIYFIRYLICVPGMNYYFSPSRSVRPTNDHLSIKCGVESKSMSLWRPHGSYRTKGVSLLSSTQEYRTIVIRDPRWSPLFPSHFNNGTYIWQIDRDWCGSGGVAVKGHWLPVKREVNGTSGTSVLLRPPRSPEPSDRLDDCFLCEYVKV